MLTAPVPFNRTWASQDSPTRTQTLVKHPVTLLNPPLPYMSVPDRCRVRGVLVLEQQLLSSSFLSFDMPRVIEETARYSWVR